MQAENQINNVFKKSFNVFKKEYVTLIIGTIIAVLMMIFIITIPPMIFGIYYLCIQTIKGKKTKVTDVFKGFNWFVTSWLMAIVALLAIAFGLILLIIPGILLMIVYQYAVAIAILKNTGPIESLKKSYHLGKNNFSFSLVLFIIVAAISGVGGLTKIGFLITMPFTSLVTVFATQVLMGGKKKKKKG